MDDFHGVLDDSHSHQLLTVVSSVHHERVREPLNDGALSLPESLHRVSSGCVGNKGGVFGCLNSNVVNKTDVCDLQDNKYTKNKHFRSHEHKNEIFILIKPKECSRSQRNDTKQLNTMRIIYITKQWKIRLGRL